MKEGAAAFLRQLVKGDLASEYENEIRLLIEEIKDMNEAAAADEPPTVWATLGLEHVNVDDTIAAVASAPGGAIGASYGSAVRVSLRA